MPRAERRTETFVTNRIALPSAGPKDTPYEGGKFTVDIKICGVYPFEPPKMRFKNKIWCVFSCVRACDDPQLPDSSDASAHSGPRTQAPEHQQPERRHLP